MGRYVSCYSSVRHQWNRIEAALRERCPQILETLKAPAEEQELAVVESELPCCLPAEVRCSYRIHKGQGQLRNPHIGGLAGSVDVYEHHSSEHLATVATTWMLETLKTEFAKQNSANLPLTVCLTTGMTQRLCLQNMPGVHAGQVFYHIPSGHNRLSVDHEGNISRSNEGPFGYFVSANSYMEWLIALADRLEDPRYTVINGRFYKFYQEPSNVALTRNVKVSVSAAFLPELSIVATGERLQTCFAYRMTMSMDENAPRSFACKLSHRHYEVTDGKGETEVVNEEGVAGGQFPVIEPGSTFSWVSYASFKTACGKMKGWFTVYNLHSGDQYDIICPCFHMKSLPVSRIDNRRVARGGVQGDGTLLQQCLSINCAICQ